MASQQNIFHRDKNNAENATYASYEVAHLFAKHGKPFSYDEFVIECLIKVIGYPGENGWFNNVSLSRQTITRRIAELSANIKDQVFEQSKSFDLCLIACDERNCD